MMKNKFLKYGLLAMAWLLISLPAMAAPGDPPTDEDPDPAAPIDNWVVFLALSAVTIGVYLVLKSQRKLTS